MKLTFITSFDINDYKEILEQLQDDFDYSYYHSILSWCGIIKKDVPNRFWVLYIIKDNKSRPVGITGLYSVKPATKELWLGWFGILPKFRNKGYGRSVMLQLEEIARSHECQKIISYVHDYNVNALRFYKSLGYKRICCGKTYKRNNRQTSQELNDDDHIIVKKLSTFVKDAECMALNKPKSKQVKQA